MYDTGFVAVVTDYGYDGHWFEPLDVTKYYIVYKTKWLKTLTDALQSILKILEGKLSRQLTNRL